MAGAALVGAAMVGKSRQALAADPVTHTTLTPQQALDRMKEGNENFKLEAPFLVAQGRQRRIELAGGSRRSVSWSGVRIAGCRRNCCSGVGWVSCSSCAMRATR